MTISPPYLKDKDNNILYFPPKFYVRSESISRRSSLIQLPFSNLSKETSDGCFNPRRVDVTGILYAADETEAQTLLDSIHAFSSKKDLELWYKGRRIKVDKLLESSLQDTGKKGFLYNVSISYQAGDPFWYSEEKLAELSNKGVLSIGGSAETYPRLIITISGPGDQIWLKVNDLECWLSGSFDAGDIIEIDSYNGTVEINSEDALNSYIGFFPHLSPGDNSFEHEGPISSIVVVYSEAYV